ncbi:MAG: hypothetical protein ABW007_27420 [Chitinophagaceae bacterium]
MRWLLFLSRLAFICGFFFLLAFSLRFTDWTNDDGTTSFIVILGYLMGGILVPVVNLCYLIVLFVKRKLIPYVPLWLIVSNLFFLVILVLYILVINDPGYN